MPQPPRVNNWTSQDQQSAGAGGLCGTSADAALADAQSSDLPEAEELFSTPARAWQALQLLSRLLPGADVALRLDGGEEPVLKNDEVVQFLSSCTCFLTLEQYTRRRVPVGACGVPSAPPPLASASSPHVISLPSEKHPFQRIYELFLWRGGAHQYPGPPAMNP